MITTILAATLLSISSHAMEPTPRELFDRDLATTLKNHEVLSVLVLEEISDTSSASIRYRVSYAGNVKPRAIKRIDAEARYVRIDGAWRLVGVSPNEVGTQFVDDTPVEL